MVAAQTEATWRAGLSAIICIGETGTERQRGETEDVLAYQIDNSIPKAAHPDTMVIAYEPVWAIGTGKTATSAQAQEVHAQIRKLLAAISDDTVANSIRIQYGGSVKASNAKELFSQPDIDGGLIGGAALESRSFVEIVKAALK
jgi:triosephosphate isomerase